MSNMNELIELINQLQNVLSAAECSEINLPQVVVVGTQSSGKSSVLEHIIGKSFLPRGTGIVTRCPLILQLVRDSNNKTANKEYAIFQHDKSLLFTDYSLIMKEIEEQTIRLAGGDKGICSTPIILKLYSPSFLNLTLVDLPGLTKVPVGDQPPDIEIQTRKLVQKYIKNPDSIIVAVTPANVDMATSESLKLAKEVDPDGERTLAVITKLDLMDKGTDAWDVLNGKVIPVKLGIIGVVNRSQKDIQDNKTIAESLKEEVLFFKKFYKNIAATNGCKYLTKRVQSLLVDNIKRCLPEKRQQISDQLMLKRKELDVVKESELDKSTHLLTLLTKFSSFFVSTIKGNLTDIHAEELSGGAAINSIFRELFDTALVNVKVLPGISEKNIVTAMHNASGINSSIFVPETAFELLVKTQIKRLQPPCLQCVDLVYKELKLIVQSCIDDLNLGLHRYPKLQTEIDQVMSDLLQSRLPVTNEMVQSLIEVQVSYINTSHPDFLPNSAEGMSMLSGGDRKKHVNKHLFLSQKENVMTQNKAVVKQEKEHFEDLESLSDDDGENRDYKWMLQLIQSYFCIIRELVQDTVPKIVIHFMVNFVIEHLQTKLITLLYNSDNAENLLEESKDVTDKRKKLSAEITALEQASAIINSFSLSSAKVKKTKSDLNQNPQ